MTSKSTTADERVSVSADPRRPAGLFGSAFSIFIALLWGGLPVSIKSSLKYGEPLQIGWMRFALGGLVTLVYMVVRRESFSLKPSEIRPILIVSLLFSVQLVFMNVGQDLTSAGHATAIGTTMPIWAATIAQIMIPSERLSRWQILAIALSYAGVLAVVFGDDAGASEGVSLLGDVLSLISAILLGLRIVLISNFAQNVSESKLMMGQQVIGTALFLVASYALESPAYTMASEFWIALAYQGLIIAGFGLPRERLAGKEIPALNDHLLLLRNARSRRHPGLADSGRRPGSRAFGGYVRICKTALVGIGAFVYGGEAYFKAMRRSPQPS